MKKGLHPKVNTKAQVTCTCGNTFLTTSVLDNIQVEVCSNCHPFYTGIEKFVDTEGRVDKFQKKQEQAKERQKEIMARIKAKNAKETKETSGPLSLKDMLKQAQKGK